MISINVNITCDSHLKLLFSYLLIKVSFYETSNGTEHINVNHVHTWAHPFRSHTSTLYPLKRAGLYLYSFLGTGKWRELLSTYRRAFNFRFSFLMSRFMFILRRIWRYRKWWCTPGLRWSEISLLRAYMKRFKPFPPEIFKILIFTYSH